MENVKQNKMADMPMKKTFLENGITYDYFHGSTSIIQCCR